MSETRIPSIALLLLTACASSGFERPSEILGPRLLAVQAEPPASEPGVDVALRAITARPDDEALSFEWRVDLSPRALARAAGQDLPYATEPVLRLTGERVQVPGEETEAAFAALLEALGAAPRGTEEGVVRTVYEEVGLELLAEVTVRDASGAILVEGFKRVVIAPTTPPSTNPPPPRFEVGDLWLSGRLGDDATCAAETEAPIVEANATIRLTPEDDSGWLETYRALDLNGDPFEEVESGYYAWFATGGSFSSDITRLPDRAVEWTAPDTAGTVQLWLVVRDGHLGTSSCRAAIEVR